MWKKILLAALFLIVAIQFVRPARNIASEPSPRDFFIAYPSSSERQRVLQEACYDCHSNTTRYPWYAQLQPVGWWLAHHINEGKHDLNFSEFAAYSPRRARAKLEEAIEELHEGDMPLPAYARLHPPARLTEEQRTSLINWLESIRQSIPAEEGE